VGTYFYRWFVVLAVTVRMIAGKFPGRWGPARGSFFPGYSAGMVAFFVDGVPNGFPFQERAMVGFLPE
jgi:hypothetical protein